MLAILPPLGRMIASMTGSSEIESGFLGSDGVLPSFLLPFHILSASAMMLTGPFLVNSNILKRFRKTHRLMGRLFVAGGVLGGISALLITILNPDRYSEITFLTNLLFGGWLTVTSVMALRMARDRDFVRHRRWAIRAFAAALTVAVHRVFVLPALLQVILNLEGGFSDLILTLFTIFVGELIIRWPKRTPKRGSRSRVGSAVSR